MASIIDTLMVVFKVDTRGLKSGIKEADIDLDRVKKSLKGVSARVLKKLESQPKNPKRDLRSSVVRSKNFVHLF